MPLVIHARVPSGPTSRSTSTATTAEATTTETPTTKTIASTEPATTTKTIATTESTATKVVGPAKAAGALVTCATRLRFLVHRRIGRWIRVSARRMLLPAIARVLVHVPIDVGIVVIAHRRRVPAIRLACSRVVSRSFAGVSFTFWPGRRRAGALVAAATRAGARNAGAGGALPGVDVVVAGAGDVARAAGYGVCRAIVATRVIAGVRVELFAGVV